MLATSGGLRKLRFRARSSGCSPGAMQRVELPFRGDHKGPFDRMLMAQALAEEIPIVSGNTRFTGYKRLRVVWD